MVDTLPFFNMRVLYLVLYFFFANKNTVYKICEVFWEVTVYNKDDLWLD